MSSRGIDSEDNMRIANNVRLIREHWEDDRKTLVELLNGVYPYDTIKAYEYGKRPVPDDYISAISNLYGVTVNMIKEQTLTEELLAAYDSKLDIVEFFNEHDFVIFAGAISEAAKENADFQEAEKCLQRIINLNYSIDDPTNARKLYFKSFEDTGLLAGAANAIMMLFVEYSHLTLAPDIESFEKMLRGYVTNGQFYARFRNIWSNLTEERRHFIKETQEIFDKCINALCKTYDGRIYAEYYMALKYLVCMVDNGREYRENLEIGSIMLQELVKLDNRFARKAVSVFHIDE